MVFFDKQRTAKQDVGCGPEVRGLTSYNPWLTWRQSSIDIIIFLQLSTQWIATIHK